MAGQQTVLTAEDQAVIVQWLREFGSLGYGLCYLLGVYRARGASTVEAAQAVRAQWAAQQQEAGS